ncbi:MAG: DUF5320 domain-containing protein [Phycisphaerae bacterium]|nr:DUF5320 domain-containing protein [Phycisphaerae bacterium]
MPGFDGTGPMGQGPMTGRGLGPCGRGMAFRRGGGRGLGYGRSWFRGGAYSYPQNAPDASASDDARIEELAGRLDRIESMLETLTKSGK